MILLTSNYAAGYKVDKVIGMVYGITVRSRGLGGNIVAGLRTIAGGEIREYTELAQGETGGARQALRAREEPGRERRPERDVRLDRDGPSMEEIIAFGTAVVISPVSGDQQLVKLS